MVFRDQSNIALDVGDGRDRRASFREQPLRDELKSV
jgi:hypothetical protein